MNKNLIEALRLIVLKDSTDLMDKYESELFTADEKRKAEKDKFEKENAPKIKELRESIKNLSVQIKTAPVEEKAKLGQQIKEINEQITSLQTPTINHFSMLSADVKGYAGSIFLLKELVKEETLKTADIPYEIDEKYKINVDYETLRDSELGSKILETSDYIADRVRDLGTKITNPGDVKNILASDFNKYNIQNKDDKKPDITFEKILESKKLYDEELAEIANRNKNLEARVAESKKGIKVLKEYPSGNVIVELLPSEFTGENGKKHHSSITFESDEMGHCVGRGGYDSVIGTEGYHFYSLRSYNKDGVLEPHCTISIEAGKLRQIKGKSNLSVKAKYVHDVRDFVKTLKKEIPASEKRLIGYIQDVNNKNIDLYNLQSDVELRNFNYASGDNKYINIDKIKKIDDLVFEDIPAPADMKALKKVDDIGSIKLESLKTNKEVKKVFDLYSIDDLPYSRFGIAAQEWGDASSYPLYELLRKMYGENYTAKENDLVILNNKLHLEDIKVKLPDNLSNLYVKDEVVIPSSFPIENLPKFDKLKLTGRYTDLGALIKKVNYSKFGIEYGAFGNLSKLPLKEVLTKLHGTEWAEKYMSEQNGKLIVNTDLSFSEFGITNLDAKNLIVNGKLTINTSFPPENLPKYDSLQLNGMLGENSVNYLSKLDYSKGGIGYDGWGSLEDIPFKEVITKVKGTDWAEKYMSEENGRVVINMDLDLAKHGISDLYAKYGQSDSIEDFKNVLIRGKLKSLGLNFMKLPETELGVYDENPRYYLNDQTLQNILTKLKGTKWAEENLVVEKGVVTKIKGDLDLRHHGIQSITSELYGTQIAGAFSCDSSLHLEKYPKAKILDVAGYPRDMSVPDSVEKIISDSQSSLRLKGKNLKEFEIKGEYMQINPEDMQSMSPDIIYKGTYVALNHAHYGFSRDLNFTIEQVDMSDIKIDGKFKIGADVSSLKWCPEAETIEASSCISLTNESLKDLNPNVKYLNVRNTKINSFEHLPDNTKLKEIIDINSGSPIDIMKSIKNTDIIYDIHLSSSEIKNIQAEANKEENYVDYENSKDLGSIKLKKMTVENIKNLKGLPLAEELSINRADNDFDKDFLKDLPSFTKSLELIYISAPDLSLIPADSNLKKINLHDASRLDKDSLQYLPESIEEIKLFACSILDLSKIETLPNLKKIEISHNTYPDDAINKISPEKLKQVEIDSSYYNYHLMNRRQEIITIHDAPSSEANDKLKQMNEWLCKDDDKRDYLYRQMAFYKLGSDIIDSKYNGEINYDILNQSADKFKDTMLKSCSEIIMAAEINAKEGDETSGRKVIEKLKDRKAGYYKKSGTSGSSNISLIKAIVTRKIEKHPDFDYVKNKVVKRMNDFSTKMQTNFNEKLSKITMENLETHIPPNNQKYTPSLNKYVKEVMERR